MALVLHKHQLLSAAEHVAVACRQDLQMRLLSLFVDFALNPLGSKQIWDLGALLPAIASLSPGLQTSHVLSKRKASVSSFDMLHDEDPNKVKVLAADASWLMHDLFAVLCKSCV